MDTLNSIGLKYITPAKDNSKVKKFRKMDMK